MAWLTTVTHSPCFVVNAHPPTLLRLSQFASFTFPCAHPSCWICFVTIITFNRLLSKLRNCCILFGYTISQLTRSIQQAKLPNSQTSSQDIPSPPNSVTSRHSDSWRRVTGGGAPRSASPVSLDQINIDIHDRIQSSTTVKSVHSSTSRSTPASASWSAQRSIVTTTTRS